MIFLCEISFELYSTVLYCFQVVVHRVLSLHLILRSNIVLTMMHTSNFEISMLFNDIVQARNPQVKSS